MAGIGGTAPGGATPDVRNIVIGPATLVLVTGGTHYTLGYTREESTLTLEREFYTLEAVNQLVVPVKRVKTLERATFTATLLELNLEMLRYIMDTSSALSSATISDTADPWNTDTVWRLGFGGDEAITEHTLHIYTMAPDGRVRRIIMHKVHFIENVEYPMAKDTETGITVTFGAIGDISRPKGEQLIEIQDNDARLFILDADPTSSYPYVKERLEKPVIIRPNTKEREIKEIIRDSQGEASTRKRGRKKGRIK